MFCSEMLWLGTFPSGSLPENIETWLKGGAISLVVYCPSSSTSSLKIRYELRASYGAHGLFLCLRADVRLRQSDLFTSSRIRWAVTHWLAPEVACGMLQDDWLAFGGVVPEVLPLPLK